MIWLILLPGESRTTCIISYGMLPGLDMYRTYPAQHVIAAGEDLDDLLYHW